MPSSNEGGAQKSTQVREGSHPEEMKIGKRNQGSVRNTLHTLNIPIYVLLDSGLNISIIAHYV